MKPGLLYKLIGHLCQFINRSMQKQPLTRERSLVIAECLTCIELILVSNSQLVEVHLALVSQIDTNRAQRGGNDSSTNLPESSTQSNEAELAAKLERLMGSSGLKLPHVAQSRVTYFYDKDSYQSSMHVSGQATPSLMAAQLIRGGDDEATSSSSTSTSVYNKSWLVSFCLAHAAISASTTANNIAHTPFILKCFDLLSIICKKYFDLLSRDLFFDQLSSLIVENIDFQRTCNLKF